MLKEKLQKDLLEAMKSKDKDTLNTLRSVKGAVQLEVINNKKEDKWRERIRSIRQKWYHSI